MNWTTELPTAPGVYWVWDGEMVRWAEVYVDWTDKSLCADILNGEDWGHTLEEFLTRQGVTHWQGPIVNPEPPK